MDLAALEPTLRGLSDPAALALLTFLASDADRYVPGVAEVTAGRLKGTRWGWAAGHVYGELAAAPGCTFDPYAGLLCVWPALDCSPLPPLRAQGRGRKLGAVPGSFVAEAARRMRARLQPESATAFDRGFAEGRKLAPSVAPPPKPGPADDFEAELRAAKTSESRLRDELGAPDLGTTVTAAERALYLRARAAGVSADDVECALLGRAAACRRRPLWRGESTADRFLRLTWLLAERDRIADAIADAEAELLPAPALARTGDLVAIEGHEVVQVNAEPEAPVQARDYSPDLLAGLARLTGRAG